jgi:hypothetical protein
MDASSSMSTIYYAPLDPAVAALLPRANVDFTQVHELSNIDVRRWELTFGGRFVAASNVLLDVFYSHIDYEDNDPYIIDEGGEYDVVWANVGWRF